MKKYLLIAAAAFYSFNVMAQNAGEITGKVTDEKTQPLPYANVLLMNAADTSLVKGALTDESGQFKIDHTTPGKYLIVASMVGYQKQYQSITVDANSRDIHLPTISLQPNTNELKGVTVTSSKPFIQMQADKLVVNVANSIVSTGGTALDVLRKAPEIMVDPQSDIVKLKNSANVLILINGKQTHLSAEGVSNLLKGTPADNIEKIEIINNPPAKYDAEGTAGIINIVMKKNQNYGTNGTIRVGAGYGKFWKYNGGLSLNHRTKKFNLYGNYNYSYNRSYATEHLNTNYLTKEEVTAIHQTYYRNDFRSKHQSFNAGADWYITDKTTVGAVITGNFADMLTFPTYGYTRLLDNKYNLDSTLLQESKGSGWSSLLSGNVYFTHSFDSTGRKLSIEADYSTFNSNGFSSHTNTYLNAVGDTTGEPYRLRNWGPTTIHIKAAQADYEQPLKKGMMLAVGIKASDVHTSNAAQYKLYQDNGWKNDSSRSNEFDYEERINAAYASLTLPVNKTTFKVGLRAEQTKSTGTSVTMDSIVKRHYTNLFPSVFIKQTLNDENELSVSYSRRITRPNYQDLNPFIGFIDLYTYDQGNPFLQPVYSNSFDLSYVYKSSYMLSVGYERENGSVYPVSMRIDPNSKEVRIMPENLKFSEDVSVNASANFNITPWWTVAANAALYYINYSSDLANYLLSNKGTVGTFNINTDITLPAQFKLELNGYYVSSVPVATLVQHSVYSVDAGLRKSFFNNKLDVKMSINDIFNTNHTFYSSNFGGLQLSEKYRAETRKAFLTLTYNFGNSKLKSNKHTESASKEELNRIQQ